MECYKNENKFLEFNNKKLNIVFAIKAIEIVLITSFATKKLLHLFDI